jgi:hypothetical protein
MIRFLLSATPGCAEERHGYKRCDHSHDANRNARWGRHFMAPTVAANLMRLRKYLKCSQFSLAFQSHRANRSW